MIRNELVIFSKKYFYLILSHISCDYDVNIRVFLVFCAFSSSAVMVVDLPILFIAKFLKFCKSNRSYFFVQIYVHHLRHIIVFPQHSYNFFHVFHLLSSMNILYLYPRYQNLLTIYRFLVENHRYLLVVVILVFYLLCFHSSLHYDRCSCSYVLVLLIFHYLHIILSRHNHLITSWDNFIQSITSCFQTHPYICYL